VYFHLHGAASLLARTVLLLPSVTYGCGRVVVASSPLISTSQPQSDKSASQKAGNTFSSNSDHNDDSLLTEAKNAVGMGEKK
jgi:hypothetical protein